jgi:hypothetical protein
MFPVPKQNLCGHRFKDVHMAETGVTWWLITQNMDFQQAIEKCSPWYGKCFNCGRNYVENQWDSHTIKSELFLLEMKMRKPKYMQCKLIFWPTLIIISFILEYCYVISILNTTSIIRRSFNSIFILKIITHKGYPSTKTLHSLLHIWIPTSNSVSHKQYAYIDTICVKEVLTQQSTFTHQQKSGLFCILLDFYTNKWLHIYSKCYTFFKNLMSVDLFQ